MRAGIAFRVITDFDSELWGLPPPSGKRWLSSIHGLKTLEKLYHFRYNPQSWKEWQRVAAIKIQIAQRIPNIEFVEYEPLAVIEKAYTVTELGEALPTVYKVSKASIPKRER